jgi:glyoxylase-like metal-dependent hydrolase (beta-lactamase superfamily II)
VRKAFCAVVLALGLIGAAPAPEVKLWRLDCGSMDFKDIDPFSDSWAYSGQPKKLTVGCFLIRHGDRYMLWDAGLGAELVGRTVEVAPGVTTELRETISSQLARIGVKPEQVSLLGVSHNHGDHIGQAAAFPAARLLIGKGDWDQISKKPHHPALEPSRLKPWMEGNAPKELIEGDKDVFGDGSVVMLATPGHSPDHHALLVRLKNSGAVLLTGDLYHFREQVTRRGVPRFNFDRAATLASFDRFDATARNLNATVIIQHEQDDIAKLPAFPKAAD